MKNKNPKVVMGNDWNFKFEEIDLEFSNQILEVEKYLIENNINLKQHLSIEKIIFEIENFLYENGVFINCISGETCRSDSNLAVVNGELLNKTIEKSTFNLDSIMDVIEYWITDLDVGVALKIVGQRWKNVINP